MSVDAFEVAERCLCGGCDAACRYRPYKSCCGACMDDSPYRQEDIAWPLPAPTREETAA